MSYDLQAFPLAPGADPEQALSQRAQAEAAPTAAQRERMHRLADALVDEDPDLERDDQIDVIELAHGPFQIGVYGDEAFVNLPYWFDGDEARAALARMLDYARVLREEGGLAVWDTQLGKLIDAGTSAADLAPVYAEGRALLGTRRIPRSGAFGRLLRRGP